MDSVPTFMREIKTNQMIETNGMIEQMYTCHFWLCGLAESALNLETIKLCFYFLFFFVFVVVCVLGQVLHIYI